MIAALLSIILTLSRGGDPCALGQPVDWYGWNATTSAQSARLAVMLPSPKFFESRPGSPYLAGRTATIAARMGAVQAP